MRNSGVSRPVLGATIAGAIIGGFAVPAMAEEAIPPGRAKAAEEAAAWAGLEYEQTDFDGCGGGTAESPRDREDEKVVLGRLQLYS